MRKCILAFLLLLSIPIYCHAALFLVYGKNNTHSNPAEDNVGCYKLGDIVAVMDDSKLPSGPAKCAAPFYLVQVTGVTKEQGKKYMAPYLDTDNPITPQPGMAPVYKTIRRRLYNVEVSSIPAAIRNELIANRFVSVTWSQVKNYIRNRRTNATAGDTP